MKGFSNTVLWYLKKVLQHNIPFANKEITFEMDGKQYSIHWKNKFGKICNIAIFEGENGSCDLWAKKVKVKTASSMFFVELIQELAARFKVK